MTFFALASLVLAVFCLIIAYRKCKARRGLEGVLHESQQSVQALQKQVQELETKLQHTVEDPITHVLGQQLFEDRLSHALRESERYQLNLGVMFVDVDDFNMINHTWGADIGNLLLQEVAKRLQASIRQVDSISRFNKDTFVLLLTQLAKPETAAIVAQRILQTMGQIFQIAGHEFSLTVSIGIALYPSDGNDAQTLLRSASHAMHLAKENSHQSYQFYQREMYENSQRELLLLAGINNESGFKEFVVYYQPIMNVADETVSCMNALLHWQHPTLGLIAPQELYKLAEKQHTANLISEWLLRAACQQFIEWNKSGFAPQLLSVPVSVRQLENIHFIYRISQILQELQFEPQSLLLEVKESASLKSMENLEKAFNMLGYLGVRIAIDQFGCDSFSLQRLKELPIQYLKLDSHLTRDIEHDQRTFALTKAIVFLAKSLSMEVIAQGVETEGQQNTLKEAGCCLLQGQFLGEPLTKQDVIIKMTSPSS